MLQPTEGIQYAEDITYGDVILSIPAWREKLAQCNADKKAIKEYYENSIKNND